MAGQNEKTVSELWGADGTRLLGLKSRSFDRPGNVSGGFFFFSVLSEHDVPQFQPICQEAVCEDQVHIHNKLTRGRCLALTESDRALKGLDCHVYRQKMKE
jgi:hypothetical protein